jgi:hypothetical protein
MPQVQRLPRYVHHLARARQARHKVSAVPLSSDRETIFQLLGDSSEQLPSLPHGAAESSNRDEG